MDIATKAAPYQIFMNRVKKHQRFFLFLIVGAVNTAFGYGIFSLLVFLGLHYTLAVLLATSLGILFNFQTTGRIVFKRADNRLFFKFLLVYVLQYVINVCLIKVFLMLSLDVYLAGAIATAICAVLSYFLNKHLVFMVKKT